MHTLPVLSYGKIIKGGPGSGNHGHAGIPGHQGGSQPKGLTTVATGEPIALTQDYKNNPLVKLFAGNAPDMAENGKLMVSAARQAALKANAADRLAQTLGITKQHANGFIKIWADSSNDHSLQSLGIQQAAANEFDTFMTYWQQDRHKETLADAKAAFLKGFEKRVAGGMDGGKAAYETINNLKAEHVYPFQIKAAKELVQDGANPKTAEEALDLFDRAGNMGIHTTQKALRTMQEDTTAMLKANGITSIRAYRGFQMEGEPPAYWSPGSTVNVRNNALSSWTIDKDVAEKYSNVKNGVLLEAEIPADRVIALPHTGIGNAGQWEVVMLGDKQRDKALVLSHGKDIAIEVEPVKPKAKPKATAAEISEALKPGQKLADMRQLGAPSENLPTFLADSDHKDSPITKAYAGETPLIYDNKINVDMDHRAKLKREVAKSLSKELSVTETEASDFVKHWAESSNDSHISSLTAQRAAAQEFGTAMSEWQADNYKATLEDAKREFSDMWNEHRMQYPQWKAEDVATLAISRAGVGKYLSARTVSFQKEAMLKQLAQGDIPNSISEAAAFYERTLDEAAIKMQQGLRHMHNETLKLFKSWDMDTVRAYRGVVLDSVPEGWKEGDTVHFLSNALSSWALEPRTANVFASSTAKSIVLEAEIPAERIIATPKTGYGCANEWEIVVLGGSSSGDDAKLRRLGSSHKAFFLGNYSPTNKGGEGSGNFHHLGIEGHQGGSLPQGLGSGGGALHGDLPKFNTIGHGSVSGAAAASATLPTVNLDSTTHVHSALDKFIQSSPALSKAATSKQPLPKSFLTPPAGGKQGDQHLGEIMRATGVDNKLPTKQNLQIGAKSMYMPVSGKDELDEYMEKRLAEKGPRSAASGGGGGFFKPHPAPGANAHAQLKPDAKVADKKKVEQARQKVRQETHGLLMSALVDAAKTGDYSQANALEVKYQLTSGVETFALLMGYQAVNDGVKTGTVVLDRSALNIHPTPILGAHRPSDNQATYPTPRPAPPRSSIDQTYPHKAQVVKIIGPNGKVVKGFQIGKSFPIKGGEGSGNFGHAGRPGEVGGSAAGNHGSAPRDEEGKIIGSPMNPISQSDFMTEDATWSNDLRIQVGKQLGAKWKVSPEIVEGLARADGYNDLDAYLETHTPDELRTSLVTRMLDNWAGSSGHPYQIAAMAGVADRLGLSYKLQDRDARQLNYIKTKLMPGSYKALHDLGEIMYGDTQAWLAEKGVKDLNLIRKGVPGEDRLFTSWTLDWGGIRHSAGGEIIEARVPAKYVFSVPTTGFGTRVESEVVLLPRPKTLLVETKQ